jgi:hypothetical protein
MLFFMQAEVESFKQQLVQLRADADATSSSQASKDKLLTGGGNSQSG